MSVTLHLSCSVTACSARESRRVTGDLHDMLRDLGWSTGVMDLCPTHSHLQPIAAGGGGGGVGRVIALGDRLDVPGVNIPESVHASIATGGGGGGNGRTSDDLRSELRLANAALGIIVKTIPTQLYRADEDPDAPELVRRLVDDWRSLSNAHEYAAANQKLMLDAVGLIPANILDGGDLVDGVRRLVAEHQLASAAHAKAADDRDLFKSQRNELEKEASGYRQQIGGYHRTLLDVADSLGVSQSTVFTDLPRIAFDLRSRANRAESKHRRATEKIGEQARELADLRAWKTASGVAEKMRRRGMFTPEHDPATLWAASMGVALGCPGTSPDHMLESARALHAQHSQFHAALRAVRDALGAADLLVSNADLAAVARAMRADHDAYRSSWEQARAVVCDVRDALGVPAEVTDADLPTVARTMVDNLDRATEDAKRWGDLLHELRGILTGNTPGVAYTDLPDLLRKLTKDREELAEHLAHRNANGGEAFIPLAPKRDEAEEADQFHRDVWPRVPYVEAYANFDNPDPAAYFATMSNEEKAPILAMLGVNQAELVQLRKMRDTLGAFLAAYMDVAQAEMDALVTAARTGQES